MNKKVVFTKIRSRLGVKTTPWKQEQSNLGVENGPDSLLIDGFLRRFGDYKILEYDFPKPERVSWDNYKKTLLENYVKLDSLLEKNINSTTDLPVFLGGDHSVAFSSLLWLTKNFDSKKVGYIHFDTHPDLNSFSSSITGNFHGIWLRPFFDKIDYKEMEDLIPQKLIPQNAVFIGEHEIEKTERDFFLNSGFNIFSRQNLDNAKKEIEKFKSEFDHVHVTFDIDVFSKTLVEATTCISENGMTREDVFPLLKYLADFKSLSFDLVEIIPRRDFDGRVIKLGQEIMETLCGLTNTK